jgi:5-carboxymethyl-2-hydroxymuconate isomerase
MLQFVLIRSKLTESGVLNKGDTGYFLYIYEGNFKPQPPMPHFVIECSENVLTKKSPEEIMQAVYEVAEATGLFAKGDIKVRISPYNYYKLGEGKNDFLHVFGNIMEGRSKEQKADLSTKIIERLNQLLPEISILSMNVRGFERDTYSNKSLINPLNTSKDRDY